MNRAELFAMASETFEKCLKVMENKNHDYSGGGGPFDNFRASAVFGIPAEKGIMLRIMDKMMRIKTYLDKGELKVANEGVLDAIEDNINYLILLKGMIIDGQEKLKHTSGVAVPSAPLGKVEEPKYVCPSFPPSQVGGP